MGESKRMKPKVGDRVELGQSTFTFEEGMASFTWPKRISVESVGDLDAWLKVVLRRILRSAKAEAVRDE